MDDTLAELEKINKNGTENGKIETKEIFDHEDTQTPLRRQFLICFGTFMVTLGAGSTAGFSAILIPQLQHSKGRHKYSIETISWLASISSFALVFGNLLSGYLMERLGRRRSQLVCVAFFISGWVLIGCSQDILYLILIGRFITGLCQGWLGPLGPVFVGEISSPIYRGFFLAAMSLGIAAGVFMSHLFGTLLHWSYAAFLCGSFPLVGGIVLYHAPESPAWLASRNRIDECIASFQWYRGTSPEMKSELDKMIAEQTKRDNSKGKIEALKLNIKKPEFYKPLFVMTLFFIITQLSGVNVICAYTTDMMNELIGGHTNKKTVYIAMLSIDVLRCVSLCLACVLLRRLGRRPLAMFSGIFTSLSLITLALYLYLVDTRVIRHITPIISLGLMAMYIIVSNLGISPLPWNMVGELFATETKGIGSGISVMMTSIAFFGTVKTAPAMFESIGHHGTYLFYGLSTLIGTLFLFFYLPETKGKTLLQVEEYFRDGKCKPQEPENVPLSKAQV
ncbi:facilitated trehalose transporter Tret1 isoform X1 [Amyelois transitella]|uniref:facilitated trehalose transporter Tret1 isoform X1 n=2 Tax=Amyelois transitella TaxID=680683 RepID=UPI00298F9ACC|nr:facilitated trehalose transporter Tret1 isoform X1 [Amyelois transitella]